jgi:hypothetical protein
MKSTRHDNFSILSLREWNNILVVFGNEVLACHRYVVQMLCHNFDRAKVGFDSQRFRVLAINFFFLFSVLSCLSDQPQSCR